MLKKNIKKKNWTNVIEEYKKCTNFIKEYQEEKMDKCYRRISRRKTGQMLLKNIKKENWTTVIEE